MSSQVVIDVSALLAVLLNEPERPLIESATENCILIGPGCVPWEIGNALYTAVKRNRMGVNAAVEVLSAFETVPLRVVDVSLAGALRIAARHKIPSYDAYYLECARTLRVPLLTLDARMRSVAQNLNLDTVEVAT